MIYRDIHFKETSDKTGYSVFVALPDGSSDEDAIKYVKENNLNSEAEDLERIDYVREIQRDDYENVVGDTIEVSNIKWCCDDEEDLESLPTQVSVPVTADEIADYLSDRFNFLVESYEAEVRAYV